MNQPGFWFGLLLIVVGGLLLLDNMYVVDFGEIIHTYWPVLFIIWGLSKISRRSSSRENGINSAGRVVGVNATVFSSTEASQLLASTVFGNYSVSAQSKSFSGGSVSNTFGNADIDLTSAELADGEQSLRIEGVFGNTTLHLPKQMAFAVHANTTFGSIRINEHRKAGISSSLDFASADFQTASKRIRISISRVFGDVVVTS